MGSDNGNVLHNMSGERGRQVAILNEGISDRDKRRQEEIMALIKARQSPLGRLGLPQLLDERRLQLGITDAAFERQPVYDRVYLYQVHRQIDDAGRFKGSLIKLADTTQDKERGGVPTAVIMGAGPIALDQLRSHGMDLGHMVEFVVSAPYFVRYDMIEGTPKHLIVVRAGDITASFDLRERIVKREVAIVWDEEQECHALRIDGQNVKPVNAERLDD